MADINKTNPDSVQQENPLLPEGLHDMMAPEADDQATILERLRQIFAGHGYARVTPPLLEFEDSLLHGPGAAQSRHMFRVMDPVSQRMMAVRTDMTGQVARIARSRLKTAPRPLRLSYGGDVLRVRGNQIRPERAFVQAGVELIGSASPAAYGEIILLARDTLRDLGIERASIDLTVPTLVPAICRGLGLDQAESLMVRQALDAKDVAALENLTGDIGPISRALLAAAGDGARAVAVMEKLTLPPAAQSICDSVIALYAHLRAVAPDFTVTIDPGEYSGFEYHSGIGFSLFAPGCRGELGRGGRYLIGDDKTREPATGFSLYLDSLMRAVPGMGAPDYIYCPFGTALADMDSLRARGLRTVCGLEPLDGDKAVRAEAKRLNCTAVWQGNKIITV